MRTHPVLTLITTLVLSVLVLAAPTKLTLEQLDKARDTHHGKDVEVTGKVEKFEQRTSRAGNAYFVFELVDGKVKVNVYSRGKAEPELKSGQRVRVVGVYRKEKKVGTRTFTNEIEITKAKDKPYGFTVLK